MTVIKRNGKNEIFSKKKIYDSIVNANSCVSDDEKLTQKQIKRITDSIVEFFNANENEDATIAIDSLEDAIEKKLMEAAGYEVAKRYITYRYEKERVRTNKSLTEKLTAANVQNQNANVDEFSFGGRIGEAASYVMKNYALEHLISKKTKHNHNNNEIYLHDLDHYAVGDHNCLSIPFDKLLKEGFNTRQVDIRPASSINTAMQLVAVIFQLQSLQQFGGVAATHLDVSMVPYVRLSFHKHYVDGLRFIDLMSGSKLREEHPSKSPLTKDEIRELSIDSDWYNHDLPAYKYAMDKTVEELNQAVEGMYHNLNSLQSRSGCQLPFTSINYGTCTLPEGRMVIKALLEGSIKGVGKFHETSIFPCGIFQCMEGVNRKEGDPNYDLFKLALKSTSLRLYPNYANCSWSSDVAAFKQDRESKKKIIDTLSEENKIKLIERLENDVSLKDFLLLDIIEKDGAKTLEVIQERLPIELMSTMGCRTYNGFDINSIDSYEKNIMHIIDDRKIYDNVQSGAAKDGRGNISPVTIIMPTLAMQAADKINSSRMAFEDSKEGEALRKHEIVEAFMKLLDKKINEAKDMLLERFDWQCSQPAKSAKFMYENATMSGYVEEEGIKSALKHGTIVIGQIGLAETLQILIGTDHTTKRGMELAKRIEQLFNEKCAKFKKELHLNFGVYLTPAENLCYTSLKKFKEKYGEIKNVSDHDFFTNSIHVPVWKKMTPFEKIDIESQLAPYSNGGCITYVELDAGTINNIEALEDLVNYAMDHDIPYFALNVPSDTCNECGYQGDIPENCPKCGADTAKIQRLRRATGYLTGDYKTAFNLGKQDEVEHRIKHNGIECC